jgi:hypothetical protein
MHKKKNQRKGPSKKRRAPAAGFRNQTKHSISRSVPYIAPDEMDVTLRFREQNTLTSSTGLSFRRFTPNAAFDVQPAVGSTETYGFDEYAALYSYYRVISYTYRIQVINVNQSTPIYVYVLNTNTDPSVSGSRFDLYATNPYCTTKLVNVQWAQGSKASFSGRMTVAKLLGSKTVETDSDYRALTTANPSDLVWLTVACETSAAAGGDSNVNVPYTVDVMMNVRFYGREVDLTLAGLQSRIQKIVDARELHDTLKRARNKKKD